MWISRYPAPVIFVTFFWGPKQIDIFDRFRVCVFLVTVVNCFVICLTKTHRIDDSYTLLAILDGAGFYTKTSVSILPDRDTCTMHISKMRAQTKVTKIVVYTFGKNYNPLMHHFIVANLNMSAKRCVRKVVNNFTRAPTKTLKHQRFIQDFVNTVCEGSGAAFLTHRI